MGSDLAIEEVKRLLVRARRQVHEIKSTVVATSRVLWHFNSDEGNLARMQFASVEKGLLRLDNTLAESQQEFAELL